MNNITLAEGTVLHGHKATYTIVRVIGSGGFGITYLVDACFRDNGGTVRMAVKEHFVGDVCERDGLTQNVIYSNPVARRVQDSMRDFLSEANRLSRLHISHENIIKIHESFEENNTAYYSMDYIEGQNLWDYVKSRGCLSETATLDIMLPIIKAVGLLHDNNTTHLDIKPHNVIIDTRSGSIRPVLIDFGLAKHYDGDGKPTSTLLTQGYSEGFSPIEQYRGISTFSPASDVYSIAATMLFCLTGKTPQSALESAHTDISHQIPESVSSALRTVLICSLNGNPSKRPHDANEFVRVYDNYIMGRDTKRLKTKLTGNKYMWIKPVCYGLACLLVIGFFVLMFKLTTTNSVDNGAANEITEEPDTLLPKLGSSVPYAYRLAVGYKGAEYYLTDSDWSNLNLSEKEQLDVKGIVYGKAPNQRIIALNDIEGERTWENAMEETHGNMPDFWMEKDLIKNLDKINDVMKIFGGEPLSGRYWTKSYGCDNDNASRYLDFEMRRLGAEYNDDNHTYNVRVFSPVAVIDSVAGYFRSTPRNMDLLVYKNSTPYYLSASDYSNMSPSERENMKKIGVVVIDGSQKFVISLFDDKGSYTSIESIGFDLPNKRQMQSVVSNLSNIQTALSKFGGQKLQYTYTYWSGEKVYGDGPSSTYVLSVWEDGAGASVEEWIDENEESVREFYHLP